MAIINAPDAVIDQVIDACIAVRDAGDRATAAGLLRGLLPRAGQNLRIALELLVIADADRDMAMAAEVEASLDSALTLDPRIRLLLARHSSYAGQTIKALSWMSGVTRASVAMVPTFHSMWRDVMIELAGGTVDHLSMFADWAPPGQQRNTRHGVAEAIIQQVVDTEPTAESLFELFVRLAFTHPLPRHVDVELLVKVATGIAVDAPLEHQVVALAFLVAFRAFTHARQLADRLLMSTHAATYPTFAKLVTLLANDMEDDAYCVVAARLIEQCTGLGDAVGERPWRWHAARLNEIEVRALALRRQSRPATAFAAVGALAPTIARSTAAADRPGHVYVGLFGQVRFGNITLPHTANYLRSQFADFVSEGGRISMGISTWAESGQREIVEHDSAGFINALLPGEVLGIIQPLRLQVTSECLHVLPNLVARLMEECRGTAVVDPASLRAILGADTRVSVASDSEFLTDFAADGVRAFGPNMQLFNQARMWHRISKHTGLLAEAEVHVGVPVTHAVLMRTDLIALSGNLYSFLAGQVATGAQNWAFADHDPHAAFIEGIGDRFIIVDRIALDRLLDGYKLMRSIIREGTRVDEAYRVRFAAHTLLNTLLFEHDTVIHPVFRHEVNFDIYRGRRDCVQLREQLARDAVESPSQLVRDGLAALLASLPTAA